MAQPGPSTAAAPPGHGPSITLARLRHCLGMAQARPRHGPSMAKCGATARPKHGPSKTATRPRRGRGRCMVQAWAREGRGIAQGTLFHRPPFGHLCTRTPRDMRARQRRPRRTPPARSAAGSEQSRGGVPALMGSSRQWVRVAGRHWCCIPSDRPFHRVRPNAVGCAASSRNIGQSSAENATHRPNPSHI